MTNEIIYVGRIGEWFIQEDKSIVNIYVGSNFERAKEAVTNYYESINHTMKGADIQKWVNGYLIETLDYKDNFGVKKEFIK